MTDTGHPAREPEAPRWDPASTPGATEVGDAPPGMQVAAPSAAPTTAPLADVIARPKSTSSDRGTTILLALAAAVAIGGIAFAAGRLTAPASASDRGGQLDGTGQLPGGNSDVPGNRQVPGDGLGFPGRPGAGGMTIGGTVSAISADSITVRIESGTEVTIPLDGETTYHAAAVAAAADVTVGSEVKVTPGARVANPDASLDPAATPGPGGRISFGAASDVTVVEP